MGIKSVGRLITGTQVAYEKPVVEVPKTPVRNMIAIKSLAELRTSEKVEIKEDIEGNQVIVPVDKRLSSYFLVNKESEYLDHNKKT